MIYTLRIWPKIHARLGHSGLKREHSTAPSLSPATRPIGTPKSNRCGHQVTTKATHSTSYSPMIVFAAHQGKNSNARFPDTTPRSGTDINRGLSGRTKSRRLPWQKGKGRRNANNEVHSPFADLPLNPGSAQGRRVTPADGPETTEEAGWLYRSRPPIRQR